MIRNIIFYLLLVAIVNSFTVKKWSTVNKAMYSHYENTEENSPSENKEDTKEEVEYLFDIKSQSKLHFFIEPQSVIKNYIDYFLYIGIHSKPTFEYPPEIIVA